MNDESADYLISTVTQGTLVEVGSVGERMFDMAVNDPGRFSKTFNERVRSLSGFSAQQPPKSEHPAPSPKK